MSVAELQKAFEKRRTIYALNNKLPISQDEVKAIVEHVIKFTPSSFNSQSTRVLVLFGAEHEKLWDATREILRVIVGDEEKFASTDQKMDSFKAGAGTVLFFEDQADVRKLQEAFPAYADNFPVFAQHADAMNQYALWTTFSEAGIGASLQHYSPVIDEKVAELWGISEDWSLVAQMPFGGIAAPAGDKEFKSLESRIKYAG